MKVHKLQTTETVFIIMLPLKDDIFTFIMQNMKHKLNEAFSIINVILFSSVSKYWCFPKHNLITQ